MSWFEAHQVERSCEKKKVYAHEKKETFPQGEPQQTELNKTVAFCNKKFCRFRSPVRVFFFLVRMIKGNLPEERPPKCNPSEEGLQVLSRRIIQVVMIKSVI